MFLKNSASDFAVDISRRGENKQIEDTSRLLFCEDVLNAIQDMIPLLPAENNDCNALDWAARDVMLFELSSRIVIVVRTNSASLLRLP